MTFQSFKRAVAANSRKVLVAAGAVVPFAAPALSHAALSASEQAMVDVVTGKLTDLVSAVQTIATANIGLIAAIVVASLIIGFMWKAGKK